jgi:hypothetical protein
VTGDEKRGMTVNECIDWLDRICADLREQAEDIPQVHLPQVHMDIEQGVGPAMSVCDELELLAINLRIAVSR